MSNYLISRDRWHWRYKSNILSAWNYFDDNVHDQVGMKKFFGNQVALSIVGADHQPTVIYEVGKIEPDFSIEVVQNAGESRFKLGRAAFIPDPDAVAYYHNRTPDDINDMANKHEQDHNKLNFYQKSAGGYVNDSFDSYVKATMSESNVTKYLKDFAAKTYNSEAEVYFSSEAIQKPGYHDR